MHFFCLSVLCLPFQGDTQLLNSSPRLQLYGVELAFSIFGRTRGAIHLFFSFFFFLPLICDNHIGTSQLLQT